MVPFWQLALGVEPLQLLQVSMLPPKVVVALVWYEMLVLMVLEVLFASISSSLSLKVSPFPPLPLSLLYFFDL
jgi:hypothetical protein